MRSTFACSSRMASAYVRRRRLHRQVADDLQQVVLDDVADDAGLLVELAAALHAEALGHRDLHVLDVVAVPDRLEERVGEAEVEDVLHRLLAEVVVDAEDATPREDARAASAFSSRADARSRPNGFSTTTRASSAQPACASCSTTRREHARRDRQVVRRALGARPSSLLQPREGRRVVVVAVDVAEAARASFANAASSSAAVLGDARLARAR